MWICCWGINKLDQCYYRFPIWVTGYRLSSFAKCAVKHRVNGLAISLTSVLHLKLKELISMAHNTIYESLFYGRPFSGSLVLTSGLTTSSRTCTTVLTLDRLVFQ